MSTARIAQTAFEGKALTIGDRVVAVAWGDGIPLYLANTSATVIGFGRTRVRVRFDLVAYGGRFADYDAVNPRMLRILTSRWKESPMGPVCTQCGGIGPESCICPAPAQ